MLKKDTPCVLSSKPANETNYKKQSDDTYICIFKVPEASVEQNIYASKLTQALTIRDFNGNIDIPGVIKFLEIYFDRITIQFLLEIINNVSNDLRKHEQKNS